MKKIWTYETCFQEAKKYSTLKEFRKNKPGAYSVSWRNKWLNDFNWLQKQNLFRNDVDCCYMYLNKELKIVYVGRTIRPKERALEHRIRSNETGAKFKEYGVILPEPIYYMNKAKFPIEYGLMIEDKLVQWFRENGWTILNKAKTGIRSGSVGGSIKKWTKNAILEAASSCKDMEDFYIKYPRAYTNALKIKIDVGLKYQVKPNGYWNNKEHCREEAAKYKTITDFSKHSTRAYNVSNNNGWIPEFFPNKQKCRKKEDRAVKMFSMDGVFIKEFNSPKSAADYLGKKEYSRINLCINGKAISAFGYKWKYTK